MYLGWLPGFTNTPDNELFDTPLFPDICRAVQVQRLILHEMRTNDSPVPVYILFDMARFFRVPTLAGTPHGKLKYTR